jgi:signal transduction histidine kinase
MDTFEEMKSWVGFDGDDAERLRAFAPLAIPRLPALADVFYDRITRHPGAAAVLTGPDQVARLKQTLVRWSEELLTGPWDQAYHARRARIGKRHVEVGLPPRYMLTAMHTWREELQRLARETHPPEVAAALASSIAKITDIDLGVMTGTYVERRGQAQVRALQDVLVSHMPVTVLLLDADGVVTAATRADIRLFGDVAAVGRHWTAALPWALVEAGDLITQLMRARVTGREITLPRVDVDLEGITRTFRFDLVPLDHPQARALIHLEELTETIHAEARLQRAETLAQLGALSAAVAHELRNPLAGISGAVQVIAASLPEQDPRRGIMHKVEEQVRRLDGLVGELLDFARPPQPRLVRVRLHELARGALELLRSAHPRVRFRVVGEGEAWADPQLVHQIVLNLAINAAQAIAGESRESPDTPEGNVEIAVTNGSVSVRDDGPGIPAGHAERIFQPFYTTRTRGTGLGLAICRKMAQAMSGTITWSAPPPGSSGATFTVRLPSEAA